MEGQCVTFALRRAAGSISHLLLHVLAAQRTLRLLKLDLPNTNSSSTSAQDVASAARVEKWDLQAITMGHNYRP